MRELGYHLWRANDGSVIDISTTYVEEIIPRLTEEQKIALEDEHLLLALCHSYQHPDIRLYEADEDVLAIIRYVNYFKEEAYLDRYFSSFPSQVYICRLFNYLTESNRRFTFDQSFWLQKIKFTYNNLRYKDRLLNTLVNMYLAAIKMWRQNLQSRDYLPQQVMAQIFDLHNELKLSCGSETLEEAVFTNLFRRAESILREKFNYHKFNPDSCIKSYVTPRWNPEGVENFLSGYKAIIADEFDQYYRQYIDVRILGINRRKIAIEAQLCDNNNSYLKKLIKKVIAKEKASPAVYVKEMCEHIDKYNKFYFYKKAIEILIKMNYEAAVCCFVYLEKFVEEKYIRIDLYDQLVKYLFAKKPDLHKRVIDVFFKSGISPEDIPAKVSELFAPPRKKITLNKAVLAQIKNAHHRTVEQLNIILQDEKCEEINTSGSKSILKEKPANSSPSAEVIPADDKENEFLHFLQDKEAKISINIVDEWCRNHSMMRNAIIDKINERYFDDFEDNLLEVEEGVLYINYDIDEA